MSTAVARIGRIAVERDRQLAVEQVARDPEICAVAIFSMSRRGGRGRAAERAPTRAPAHRTGRPIVGASFSPRARLSRKRSSMLAMTTLNQPKLPALIA